MLRRLVLGCGTIGHVAVERLADRPGDLHVVDDDEGRIETLRNDGISAERGDPADVGAVADRAADLVVVGIDDARRNLGATRAAREAFPDAHVVAYAAPDATPDVLDELSRLADRVIEHDRSVADAVLERVTGDGRRVHDLRRALDSIDGRLGVFTHDDPDPDAIGSALALVAIAQTRGTDAGAYYFGEIAHQENRALVNLLDLDLTRLDVASFDSDDFDAIALVDHSRPGVNDRLPVDLPVDIVIDHHPPRAPIGADFVDLRSDVGATSTLLVDYVRGFDLELDPAIATALLYGIRVDTRDFGREITGADFEAAAYLLPQARTEVLERVESPSISGDTLDTIALSIENYRRVGEVVISGVSRAANRDAIAQAADQLLSMEDVTVTVVFGIVEDTVYVSGRTRGSPIDIGETMRRAFDPIGSAGGHTDMAGAQISLGILRDVEAEESLAAIVSEVISDRFLEELGLDGVEEVEGQVDAGIVEHDE